MEQDFEFTLSPATEAEAEELYDAIIAWAEAHGKFVGGGTHPVKDVPESKVSDGQEA